VRPTQHTYIRQQPKYTIKKEKQRKNQTEKEQEKEKEKEKNPK